MKRLIMLLFCAVCTVSKIEKNIAFEKGVTDLKCDLSTPYGHCDLQDG